MSGLRVGDSIAAVDGDVPAVVRQQQRPARHGRGFHARQVLRPFHASASIALRAAIVAVRPRPAPAPGRTRSRTAATTDRSNVVLKRPAAKRTNAQNVICTTSSDLTARRERTASPPLSAATGETDEARSAGANPKSAVTKMASDGGERDEPPVEIEHEPDRDLDRLDHRHHRRRRPPRRRARPPRTRRAPASRSRRTSSGSAARGRRRSRRGAPSPSPRAMARPVSRFPTVAQAMTRTSATSAVRMSSGVPRCV